jgi:hypothetical protein
MDVQVWMSEVTLRKNLIHDSDIDLSLSKFEDFQLTDFSLCSSTQICQNANCSASMNEISTKFVSLPLSANTSALPIFVCSVSI